MKSQPINEGHVCGCGDKCRCGDPPSPPMTSSSSASPVTKASCHCASCKCTIGQKGGAAASTYRSEAPAGMCSVSVEIDGMTCSSCVTAIEGLAGPSKKIDSISVNLILGEARITYNSEIINVDDVIQAIEDVGFEARQKSPPQALVGPPPTTSALHDVTAAAAPTPSWTTMVFDVEGMTCASCSLALETGLKKTEGVVSVSVNLIENVCHVDFDEAVIGVRGVISVISDIGYGARIHHPSKDARQERQAKILREKLIYFLVGLAFSIPAFLVAMVFPMIPGMMEFFEHEVAPGLTVEAIIMLVLATPVQFILGAKFYIGAYKSLAAGVANMDVLIVLGTTAAFAYSVASIVLDATLGLESVHFFEISILLITFVYLGSYLETYAKGKTSEAITKLMSLQAVTATIVEISEMHQVIKETVVETELIQKGDILKIAAGEQIPVDGVVLYGTSSIDESMLTGESMPVTRGVGDPVIGATINLQGQLLVKATMVGSNTTLAKIVKMVEEAQTQKAPIQAVADQVSRYFVPIVVLISILTFVVWFSLAKTGSLPDGYIQPGLNEVIFALLFSIAVLVIACPCALGLATPTAVMVGTGVAARFGILIKGGAALEKAYKLSAIIFDKTGTLTQGKPIVTEVLPFTPGLTPEELLSLAASIEASSSHPLAKAIIDQAKIRGLSGGQEAVSDLTEVAGKGLRGSVQGKALVAGNLAWMTENGCVLRDQDRARLLALQERGVSVVLFGLEKLVIGVIGIADVPRAEAASVVRQLQQQGLEVWMVTGDNHQTAAAVAEFVGITNIFSEVLPHQKSEKVAELQRKGHSVAMIGDGINDSPALAKADVGIAIGAGTDVAIETADIVLMKSNLWDVATAIDLSKTVFRRIKFNFGWAFGYNIIGIPVAAGVLFPVILVHFPPFLAALAMVLSSVSVIMSSLLLRFYRAPKKPGDQGRHPKEKQEEKQPLLEAM